MDGLAGLLPLIAIAAIFWLLIIRPASRRQKQMAQLQSGLAVGDEVVFTSGIYGTVVELADGTVDVEVADGVVLTVARGAIGSVVPPVVADDGLGDELESPADELDDPADDSRREER